MSTNNICFHGELRKNITRIPLLMCRTEFSNSRKSMVDKRCPNTLDKYGKWIEVRNYGL